MPRPRSTLHHFESVKEDNTHILDQRFPNLRAHWTIPLRERKSAEAFVINYLAEIPLWFMCDYALEEMEEYIGKTTSDLLDIVTPNTVQVTSSVLLLKAGQVSVLQTSLVEAF